MRGLRSKRLYRCQFTLSTQLIILNYPVTLYTVQANKQMSYLHDWKIHHLTAVCSSPETKKGFSGNEACILTKGIEKHPPSYQCLSSGWQTEKENRKSKTHHVHDWTLWLLQKLYTWLRLPRSSLWGGVRFQQNQYLTLYTPTSVCIFSILFTTQILRCWDGEFGQESRASL